MSDLRKKILEINKRDDISPEEKSKLIFQVMNPNHNQKKDEESEKKIICKHYKRSCLLKCPDCEKFYPCRVCHDEHEDHKMDRSRVKEIKCKECNYVQEKSNRCQACDIYFAKYYCAKCTLYDDDETKIITHCDKCGICRIGDTIHCDLCDMCYDKSIFDGHKCNGKFDAICPICNEYLKDSREPVTTLPCNHTIHQKCYQQNLMNGNYQCPICKKSTTNMDSYWEQIENYVSQTTMPDEYKDVKAEIYCNDCEEKSVTNFHFAYHKCGNCGSWNTNIDRTFKDDEN